MASDWYPVIDTGKCIDNCFACEKFCPQKVFEKEGMRPVVGNPDLCLKDCDSCKSVCPADAITFISTTMIEVDGIQVGIEGLNDAFEKHRDDFDAAFGEISKKNYFPENAKDRFRSAIKREFEKGDR